MPKRRLRQQVAHLEVTAFINLIVVLVPFLLSTAVFTRLAVVPMDLPTAAAPAEVERLGVDRLQLEVVLRADAIEVGDRVGGLIQRLPRTADGTHDVAGLSAVVQAVKARFPQEEAATVLVPPELPYDTLVQVMDAVREQLVVDGPRIEHRPLFPRIALGDAPVPGAVPARAAAVPATAGAARGT